jgi:hypothetical protein
MGLADHAEGGMTQLTVPTSKLRAARHHLAKGLLLTEVAQYVRLTARECDLLLWRGLGERLPEVAPPPKLTVEHDPRRRQLGADREVALSDDERHLGLIAKAGARFPSIKSRGDA